MSEHPIIFQGWAVRAILEGRKTQTRRVIRPQPKCYYDSAQLDSLSCPHGRPGSILWVRETWGIFKNTWTDCGWEGQGLVDISIPKTPPQGNMYSQSFLVYKADGYETCEGEYWKPSIHMPRWASRLILRLTDVRVQRVQEITEEDARAEGIPECKHQDGETFCAFCPDRKQNENLCSMGFAGIWDSINTKTDYGWDANPWVWALTFVVERAGGR